MIEKISQEDLEFMLVMHNPVALAECLFTNFENVLQPIEEETQLAKVRTYQLPMFSYEYMLFYNKDLTKKQNFELRKGAGTIYSVAARKLGKTLFVEIIDICISALLLDGEEVVFTSCDALHIRPVLDKVMNIFSNNQFINMFVKRMTKSPNYKIEMENGYVLQSVNQNYQSRNPGNSFFGHHCKRMYIEEISTEIEEVYKKRIEAVSDHGCVVRASGMTNFTKYSPIGKIFSKAEYKPFIHNIPIYANPEWNEEEKKKAVREHGGEETMSYKVFCLGKIMEDGIAVIDMQKVRDNYLKDKEVKVFEITKERFPLYTEIIILDRPKGVDEVWIAMDYGETAPSEIAIFFKTGATFQYVYNITLLGLTDDQQYQIVRWIAGALRATMIALDTTEGGARAVFRALESYYGRRDNLCWVHFSEKLVIDYERDDKNKVIFKDGKMIEVEERVAEWSIKRLKTILYEAILRVPFQYKLDEQLNSIVAIPKASMITYETVGCEDHLVAAFRVFGIAHFINEFKKLRPLGNKTMDKAGV